MELIITFRKSTSKNLNEAINSAKQFDRYFFGEVNTVTIQLKEIFEKFEFFNILFWITVDWKGTTIEYEGFKYHSHTDKTMIFYSLQQSYLNWRCCTEYKLVNSYRVYVGDATSEMIENEILTNDQADRIIDYYNIKKQLNDNRTT